MMDRSTLEELLASILEQNADREFSHIQTADLILTVKPRMVCHEKFITVYDENEVCEMVKTDRLNEVSYNGVTIRIKYENEKTIEAEYAQKL